MILFTKTNGLRFLAGALYLLLVLNCLRFRTEYFDGIYSELSQNRNSNLKSGGFIPTLEFLQWNNVINATPTTVIGNFTSMPQDLPQLLVKNITGMNVTCIDPDPKDGGPISPNTTLESLDNIDSWLGPLLQPGGAYEPNTCIAKHHVAIVVPYRNRATHLSVFLRNLHPFLMKQRIAYRIFVIEQQDRKPFNRASLMNVGYLEALKLFQWDCFIFHDVDLLPLDDRNVYNCPRQPRHMSVAVDKMNFKLPYRTIFGGVSAMTREHFQKVNGFSNSFFGWGGEDDDMANRIVRAGLFVSRYPFNIARYMMLSHRKQVANPKRFEYLKNGQVKAPTNGINSIKYEICGIEVLPTFTWYLVNLNVSE